jgi:hypothetical protein
MRIEQRDLLIVDSPGALTRERRLGEGQSPLHD